MPQLQDYVQKAFEFAMDPVMRKQQELHLAKRKGIARMLEPLAKALSEADALSIQFHGEKFTKYMEVVNSITPVVDALQPQTLVETPKPVLLPQKQQSNNQHLSKDNLPFYVVSPSTLVDAYTHLTQHLPGSSQEPEWMLAVTGIKCGDMRTMERLIEVRLAQQSFTRAGFDMEDFARIAISLHEQGSSLHAIWHSHRFAGPPNPSKTDSLLQDILDQGGYPAIQAVFSEDGYVRFFAHRPFELSISGKGVDCVDKDSFLYRIVTRSTFPKPGDVKRATE